MAGKRRARGRDISGILLLDKPLDISSNKALQRARAIYNARKAGHTGSLDPKATGLLPLCFGEATKFSNYLLNSDKTYEACCQLGVVTTTGDIEGEIIEENTVPEFSLEAIDEVLQSFAGDIQQLPPMHSALKHNGQPLYKLARKGLEVPREARAVSIRHIEMLDYSDHLLTFRVTCSKGTYVRTLAEDIGKKLGCGAHIASLRRTKVGELCIENAVTMDALQALRDEEAFDSLDNLLQPIELMLSDWPLLKLSPDSAHYLKQGQAVFVPGAPTNGMVGLKEGEGMFLGLGEIMNDGRVAPRRLVNTA